MRMPEVIETARLRLRMMELGDAEAIGALMTFEVAQYLTSVPWPNTGEDVAGFLEEVSRVPGQYTVEEGGAMIGVIGGSRMLGYWYGPAAWGKGYATEAALAYRDAWFAGGAEDLRSGHVLANQASARVLAKIGMETEGYKVEMLNRNRARAVLRMVSLSRARWQALTAGGDSAKRQA